MIRFVPKSLPARLCPAVVIVALALMIVPARALTNLNFTLVSQAKPSANPIAYGDVWAEDQLACLGVWTGYSTYSYGVGIYSISNPAAPALLSTYNASPLSQNQFELGAVRNRIGYFGSWSGGGLHIVSLTNPALPSLLCRVGATTGNVTNGFDRIHTLFLERDFLYQAAHVDGSLSVKVFNIANPTVPVFLQNIFTTNTTKVHQMTVRQNGAQSLLFTSGWGNGGASPGQTDIWDVTQVGTQPAQWLGRIYSGYNSHSSWPTPDGNTLIVCRELTGGDVKFHDISNPATIPSNALPITTITPASMGIEADIPHNPVVVSNFLFLSWYQNGIQVFDITDRTNPVRVGYFDTYPAAKTTSYQGNWGVYPWLGFDKILLSDIQSGMFVLNGMALLTPTNNYPPLVVQSPASQSVTQGFTATFAPAITGSLLKYQWFFNSAPIAAATNATLALNNVQTSQAGNYFVTATNNSGAVTSAVAVLSVIVPTGAPLISSQPPNLAVYPDNPATFTVGVVGAAPFTFQWRFNGMPIAKATNQSFTVDPALPEHVGFYSVVVSNFFGSATSTNALLSMLDSPYVNSVVAAIGARSALIAWNTTAPADSQVQYEVAGSVFSSPNSMSAAAASLGSQSYIDSRLTTNHLILLTSLAPGTRYSFQTLATSGTNTYVSGVYQFTTSTNEAPDFPTGQTVPDWWRNYFFGGATNPNADPDGDGFSTAQEYLTGTSPTDASSSLRVVAQTDASAARITFWPFLGNRSYQLLVRTNITDVNWQVYQPANILATPYGHGIFTVPLTNAPRSFFRVQVQWSTNQSVAGSFQIQAARSASGTPEATCGPYRVFVRSAELR